MKIFVKVLQGDGCMLEVQENTTILEVKTLVERDMKIPVAQQTLVLLGKTLADEQTIASYPKIKDGSKVHLVIKKPESLETLMSRYLQQYYSESHANLIVDEFMRDFDSKVHNLSLDDLERIAMGYLNDENV